MEDSGIMNESNLNNGNTGRQRRWINLIPVIALIAAVLALLLGIEYYVLSKSNLERAYQTGSILIHQVQGIIKSNDEEKEALTESLKESYTAKAKAVAYIIDHNPGTDTDIKELKKIAGLMQIDEIHVFDDAGRIYSGTVPEYYGYSFDSGEQIAYFKPMLKDKELSMCQDVTPNTAEEKSMMYAICWNETGDKMIQVGIEPVRLIRELHANEISEILNSIPSYEGVSIVVANATTGRIEGSTYVSEIGRSLANIGILQENIEGTELHQFVSKVDNTSSACTTQRISGYVILVAQDLSVLNQNIPVILMTVLIYLLLAAIVIGFIVWNMTRRIIDEQTNANTDPLTGLQNRRAYEDEMKRIAQRTDRSRFAYVSMDLNNLKEVNDVRGHEAGDLMLRDAAACIREHFGGYGNIYRIGGDEFAALLFAEEESLQEAEQSFIEGQTLWTQHRGQELSISHGSVRAEEFPQMTPTDLSRIADERMYEDKARYYRETGIDRRRSRRSVDRT